MKKKTKDFKKILAATTLAAMVSFSDTFASEYQSLYDAVRSSDNPRTYTLEETEISSRVLGNMGGASSTLTIDGGTGNWGIQNTSTTAEGNFIIQGLTLRHVQLLTLIRKTIIKGLSWIML